MLSCSTHTSACYFCFPLYTGEVGFFLVIVHSCVGYPLPQCDNLFVFALCHCVKGIIRNLGIENGDRAAVLSFHKDGFGVLHCAACQGHLEVCKYLVEELGCDPNMAASGGSCEGSF